MPQPMTPEEKERIKDEIRKKLDSDFAILGQEGFINLMTNTMFEVGELMANLQERLIMGRGADF